MRVHRVSRAEVAIVEPVAWRQVLVAALREGGRVVTLYGRRHEDRVTVTAVIEGPTHALRVSRTELVAATGYPEMTSEYPALHCFERELHEQTGLHFADHPWLKPLRFTGRDAATDAYPFYKLAGKEVHEVAVGPIHAGVIEPGSFRFSCLGEIVHHLEIHLGYQHRGVEARLLEGDPRRRTPLVETIAGDTTIAHAWAYAAAIESLASAESLTLAELPPGVEAARGVALELERVAMHLAGLAGLAGDLAFLQGATTYGRLRTTAINTTMRLCGSRFGRGAIRPGGIGMTLDAELVPDVLANLELLREDLAIIDDHFVSARTVQHRLRQVGVLTTARALELGMVGMAARASGLPIDARRGGPIEIVVHQDGDCFARAKIRIDELAASLAWLAEAVDEHPAWSPTPRLDAPLAPDQLAIAIVEGWRGEVVHCLETGSAGELVHYKVQDPSLRNWMGLAIAMRGNEISDFPICNKSFDLSYCGHDL